MLPCKAHPPSMQDKPSPPEPDTGTTDHLPEAQQVLEGVLHEQAGDDAHGGGQARRAHALALQRALVDAARHHQRRAARKARRPARDHHLRCRITKYLGMHRLAITSMGWEPSMDQSPAWTSPQAHGTPGVHMVAVVCSR